MWICRGAGMGRRFVLPALVLGASLIATVAPASAKVLAYRTSDGSADPAFVTLGAATTVERVVPDGARGTYLIGGISVNGGTRAVVHVLADGTVDPAFRLQVRGGHVVTAAVRGAYLALSGTFTSVGGKARAGLAVVDARTARPLAWAPAGRPRAGGDVVFAGPTLVASGQNRISAWRTGVSSPLWTTALDLGQTPATLAVWRGSVVVLANYALTRLDVATGAAHPTGIDVHEVSSMQVVGGKLLGNVQGVVVALGDTALSKRLVWCGRADDSNGGVVSIAGDGGTLYVGDAPWSPERQNSIRAVTACPLAGGASEFTPPRLAYGAHTPLVRTIALVGSHVLVFTA